MLRWCMPVVLCLGLVVLAWLLVTCDWRSVATRLSSCSVKDVALGLGTASAAFVIGMLVRCWRFNALLERAPAIRLHRQLGIFAAACLFSLVTPGRLGDALRIWQLGRAGVDRTRLASAWVHERCLDLLSLFALAGAAIAAALWGGWGVLAMVVVYVVSLPVLQAMLPLLIRVAHAMARRLPGRMPFRAALESMLAEGATVALRRRRRVLLLTMLIQSTSLGSFLALANIVHPLGAVQAAMAGAVATVASLLPLSISGLGIREAGNIGMLGAFGMSRADALMVSLADGFLLPVLLLAVMAAMFYRRDMPASGGIGKDAVAV